MKILDHIPELYLLLNAFGLARATRLASRDPNDVRESLDARALPNAPDGYSPGNVDCPTDRPRIREASDLSPNETSWLRERRPKTVDPLLDLFKRLNVTGDGFDGASYISDHRDNTTALPNIALAFSGGGYRAMLNGGGALQAFDSREEDTTGAGQLGGLLQASTYIAGLSGGSWLVGSIFLNNFTTISTLLAGPSGSPWELQNSILQGPDAGKIQLFDTATYFDTIYDDVEGKNDAGFPISVTDYWGRALSFQLINAEDGGSAYTWSSIAQGDEFSTADTPFPIVVADGRRPGELLISLNTTVYEFNPYEFGTFDPTVYGFVPLEYLGSNFSNGSVPTGPEGSCVRGYDNAGYVMGTSSSLFNQFLLQSDTVDIPELAQKFVQRILGKVSADQNDIAEYNPNPFYGFNPTGRNLNANFRNLSLVDGGEDLQNIPLQPLIQPGRSVDVIFAVDSSADTETSWPNGTSLVATYERSTDPSGIANGTAFPTIPSVNTFVNLGLNRRPTFFGCPTNSNDTGSGSNSSSSSSPSPPPLIVYIPNAPYNYLSNVSTFTRAYETQERDAMISNGRNVATMANSTVSVPSSDSSSSPSSSPSDSSSISWTTCVGCAILSRSLERTGTPLPDVCVQCFRTFCWDGTTVNDTVPGEVYRPGYYLEPLPVSGSSSGGGEDKKSAAVGRMGPMGGIGMWSGKKGGRADGYGALVGTTVVVVVVAVAVGWEDAWWLWS